MLKTLNIQNYLLIKQLELTFFNGFTTITGETGAGKSILLGALGLLLGKRTDTQILKNSTEKCIIEGVFSLNKSLLDDILKDIISKEEIIYEDNVILRRIITPQGRSRSFINDIPVNLDILKKISTKLIDIHSQNQNSLLTNKRFSLEVIDNLAGLKHLELKETYHKFFLEYTNNIIAKDLLVKKIEKDKKEKDYYLYQLEQLQEIELETSKNKDIEEELETLNHSEEIKSTLQQILNLLNDENEFNVSQQLHTTLNSIHKINQFLPISQTWYQRLETVLIELDDLRQDMTRSMEETNYDPQRLEFLTQKLNIVYTLQEKHQVSSTSDLLEIQNKLEKQVSESNQYNIELKILDGIIKKQAKHLKDLSITLSSTRKKNFLKFSDKVKEMLIKLGMKNANLEIKHEILFDFDDFGIDKVSFLFAANTGIELIDINKAISGGEMSRVMLIIKVLLSESLMLPTIIFDEVDTGVSGDIADRMGEMMKIMSHNRQVYSITHLPQVAAKGHHHYLVQKKNKLNETETNIHLLSDKERIEIVAKMLSGKEVTKAALEHAKFLLKK